MHAWPCMQEPALVQAAEALWQQMAAHQATAQASQRMLDHIHSTGSPRLGSTGWNAYSINVDFRTGTIPSLPCHLAKQALADARKC